MRACRRILRAGQIGLRARDVQMGATDGIVCRPVEVVLRPGEMDAGRVDGALLLLGGALTLSAAVLL